MDCCAEQIVEQHIAVARVGFVISREGIGQDLVAGEPARAAATALSRAWFDCRAPVVMNVSQP